MLATTAAVASSFLFLVVLSITILVGFFGFFVVITFLNVVVG